MLSLLYRFPFCLLSTKNSRSCLCLKSATKGTCLREVKQGVQVHLGSLWPCLHTVGDGGNREKMTITHADEPGNCPDPSSTPDNYMGGFCAFNFTSGPAAGNFCWDQQPDYTAYRESSFGHGILEVKNETHALWTWHRNQDMYNSPGDQIYIVRQPERCPTEPKKPVMHTEDNKAE